MIKFLTCRFNKLVLSFVLLLGVVIGFPNVAAAKSVKSVSLDPSNGAVNVAAIYETSLETQKDVIKSMKSSKSLLKKAPGFESLSVLKSEDGTRVIVQPKVIASVEKMMPSMLVKKPAPQATTLLRSVDNTDVALLANWNCSADFEDTGKPAAFDQPDADLVALADNDQRLYDVVQIMSAKSKESKESQSDE